MPTTVATFRTLYTFDELDEQAKERARDWYRGCSANDFADLYADAVLDDAVTIGELLGIEFDSQSIKLMDGTYRHDPTIYWSGFSSQGDGACFTGRYQYRKGCARAIRKHAPEDTELHNIADWLYEAQRRNGYDLRAEVMDGRCGSYTHSRAVDIHVFYGKDESREVDIDAYGAITDALRSYMDWIYDQLRKEYEYQNEDAQVDDAIRANEYTFNADGRRED